MSGTIENRRSIIERHVDIEQVSILEIGALDAPTYRSNECQVKYLDYSSTEELARKGDDNPRYRLENIVHVDYVCPGPAYSSFLTETFDLVIANHVIEHIPDTIRWLAEIHTILNDKGTLFLSVPEKRYTFDIQRRNTDFIDLLRCYNEKTHKPDLYQILSHFYYYRKVDAIDCWEGNIQTDRLEKRFDAKTALEVATKHAQSAYADVHCHVYTCDSFRELLDNLQELGMCPFDVLEITETEYPRNEFHVMLRKQ